MAELTLKITNAKQEYKTEAVAPASGSLTGTPPRITASPIELENIEPVELMPPISDPPELVSTPMLTPKRVKSDDSVLTPKRVKSADSEVGEDEI